MKPELLIGLFIYVRFIDPEFLNNIWVARYKIWEVAATHDFARTREAQGREDNLYRPF